MNHAILSDFTCNSCEKAKAFFRALDDILGEIDQAHSVLNGIVGNGVLAHGLKAGEGSSWVV